jgi:hypothetical protein
MIPNAIVCGSSNRPAAMTSAQAFGPLLLDIRQDLLNAMFGKRDDKPKSAQTRQPCRELPSQHHDRVRMKERPGKKIAR